MERCFALHIQLSLYSSGTAKGKEAAIVDREASTESKISFGRAH